jgi:hypothetical protein
MAHTPGPWHLGERHLLSDSEEQYGYTVTAVGGTPAEQALGATFHVAEVGANPGDEECESNAHLIAAAPELLRACREMAGIIHSMSESGVGTAQGCAAPYFEIIRRAEGRSE